MATKNIGLFVNNEKYDNDSGQVFTNLNLNQSHGYSDQKLIQSYSKSNFNKDHEQSIFKNYNQKEERSASPWMKNDSCSRNTLKNLSLYDKDVKEEKEEREEAKKRWKNSSNNTISNSSTLSLHISAYENSIGLSKKKKENSSKKVTKNLSSSNLRDPFEFPRQMNTDKYDTAPEVMQFKASQKLLSRNQDMIFFERRLTEVISSVKPKRYYWIAYLGVLLCATIYSSYFLLSDPNAGSVTIWELLCQHPIFVASIMAFFGSFFIGGIHRKLTAHKIIAARCRTVLADFCLSCDESGKLIVRPANVANGGSTLLSDRNASFA